MPEAIAHLDNYSWPGNVRELSNLIERLLVLYPGQQITDAELPVHFKARSEVVDLPAGEVKAGPQLDLLEQEDVSELFAVVEPLLTDGSLSVVLDEPIDLKNKLADLERDFIVAALDQTDWVIAHAANWLKLQRTTLVEKMRKYEISR
jgi:sigma-54 specific flagellar transcriptional regulator A